jgi:hypothetical protein
MRDFLNDDNTIRKLSKKLMDKKYLQQAKKQTICLYCPESRAKPLEI